MAALFKGALYGLILVNEVLSDDELSKAESYLAAKSGVTLI